MAESPTHPPVQSTVKKENTGHSHTHSCKSLEVCRGTVEVSILLECVIISLGDCCPVFQDSVMVINFKGQNVHGT